MNWLEKFPLSLVTATIGTIFAVLAYFIAPALSFSIGIVFGFLAFMQLMYEVS